jgi:hypothetical protein
MAIDLSQFYQVFFEEAQEHLDSMEPCCSTSTSRARTKSS